MLGAMTEATRILNAMDAGDPTAAAQLLPLVYDELRRLATQKLSHEAPGQTLDPTALVHEAYLRLIGDQQFDSRGHFFAAAAEAMRRILVESARRKRAEKRGGTGRRVDLDPDRLPGQEADPDDWIALDQALTALAAEDPAAAELARLRVFAGLSVEQAGESLGLSRATAFRQWTFARAWLTAALDDKNSGHSGVS
jgi:RNA polymerase sigma factor (TIGR02999 family)